MVKINSIEDLLKYQESGGDDIQGVPARFVRSSITLNGNGSTIKFGDGVRLEGANLIILAGDGHIDIGDNSSVKSQVRAAKGSTVKIGKRLTSTGGGSLSAAEGANLTIGDDCMFAIHIDIRTDHSHPIFDRRDGSRINQSKDVVIGDHVWLSPYVKVYPGAVIGEGSVVGAGSLVTKMVPANCVAVGVPARVTRRNIVWDKKHLSIDSPWAFDNLEDLGGRHWVSDLPFDDEDFYAAKAGGFQRLRGAICQGLTAIMGRW